MRLTDSGVFMRFNLQSVFRQTILVFSIAAPGWIWAQDAQPENPKADAPVTVASIAQPIASETSKAHDDSFVIGANDVLAINVWKEPDVKDLLAQLRDYKDGIDTIRQICMRYVT